jgi:diacylglycerol kinase family enzyme
MRALLVVNPRATATTAGGRDVLAHALASATKLDVIETDHRGHAAEAAAYAHSDGMGLVVVHGGDGTVNEVVNGLLATGIGPDVPALGVVPGGSANVFARALGMPRDPVEATARLLRSVEAGTRRRIGLGRADGRWFTFNAGMGWDADVVAGVDKRRSKKAGQLLYMRMGLASYLKQAVRGPELTVQLPDAEPATNQRLVFVSNTDPWTYLGARPVRLNPDASFTDGLALFATSRVGPVDVTRTVVQSYLTGGGVHGRNFLRTDDVGWIRVSAKEPIRLQVDGDLVGKRNDVLFESVPNALTIAG